MPNSSFWTIDKFKNDLGSLLLKFNSSFLSEVNSVITNPKGNRKDSMKALIAMDMASINNDTLLIINEIEDALRWNAYQCLTVYGVPEEKISSFISQYFYPGSLKILIIDELNSTVQQLISLKSQASVHLNIIENNTGVKSFFRGLLKGYADPVDGVSHAFGNSSMQMELASSIPQFNASAMQVGNAIDAVSQKLQTLILDKWNRDLSNIL